MDILDPHSEEKGLITLATELGLWLYLDEENRTVQNLPKSNPEHTEETLSHQI